jgi:hypothetical protein
LLLVFSFVTAAGGGGGGGSDGRWVSLVLRQVLLRLSKVAPCPEMKQCHDNGVKTERKLPMGRT